MLEELITPLVVFLVFGGGFVLAFVLMVISSRKQDLRKRLVLIATAFFFITTEHACYRALDNFGSAFGNSGNAADLAIVAYFVSGLWSLYLLRKTKIVQTAVVFSKYALYGVITYTRLGIRKLFDTIMFLNRKNRERYSRMNKHG